MLLEPTDTRFTVPKSNGTTANQIWIRFERE
jgi:hypothetical protein